MRGKEIKKTDLAEWILWMVSYTPVIMIILIKYFFSDKKSGSNWNSKLNFSVLNFNFQVNFQILLFLVVVFSTVLLFKLALFFFLRGVKKELRKPLVSKIKKIISFKKLSLDKYSFFILSLMLPFIFESGESIFDLWIIFSLITILIVVMIKMNQITVNPIFLFSNLSVFEAEILKVSTNPNIEGKKKVTIITNYNLSEIENLENEKYIDYFDGVYFILK